MSVGLPRRTLPPPWFAMSTESRNKRLDDLQAATVAWADRRIAEYQRRIDVAKKILKGRTGSERLAERVVETSSLLVVKAIADFMTGD